MAPRFCRIVLTILLMFLNGCGENSENQPDEAPKASFHVDQDIQALIAAAVNKFAAINDPVSSRQALVSESFLDLVQLADNRPIDAIQQLTYFMAHADGEEVGGPAVVIFYKLSFSDSTLAKALIPLLASSDQVLRKEAVRLLEGAEHRSSIARPDFKLYRNLLSPHAPPPPDALVEHMFRRDAGSALATFAIVAFVEDAENRKPFLWAGRVVEDMLWKRQYGFIKPQEIPADVPPQLDLMAARPEWWARLYVAAIVEQHPELATPALVEKLRADDNDLVRKFADRIKPPPAPKAQ